MINETKCISNRRAKRNITMACVLQVNLQQIIVRMVKPKIVRLHAIKLLK